MNKKEAEADAIRQNKEGRVASGRSNGMSGRDLFTFNPNLGIDSDDDDDDQNEFDITGYRAETDGQNKAAEDERIRKLEQDFGNHSIEAGED